MNTLKIYDPDNKLCGPLSRDEKLFIIASILSGMASKPHFNEDTIKSRIEQCLEIAEQSI